MKITIYNKKDTYHLISKTNGQRLNIPPRGSVSFITNNDNEINYWRALTPEALQKYELGVAFDNEVWNDVIDSMNSCVSDVYEVEEQPITTKQTQGYTEEYLMSLDKEDLFNICKNFDIPYKRNNSVKTLVKLILEKAG